MAAATIVSIVGYCAACEFARVFCFMTALLCIQKSATNTGLILETFIQTSGSTDLVCLKIGKGWWTRHQGPMRCDTRCLILLLAFVLPWCWAVSCTSKQSKMAAFTKRSSNVKGNRCQRGNKVQGQEIFLVSMTSSGQRVVQMLVGITAKLRFKGGFEGGYCAYYSVLSILSLLSCKS